MAEEQAGYWRKDFFTYDRVEAHANVRIPGRLTFARAKGALAEMGFTLERAGRYFAVTSEHHSVAPYLESNGSLIFPRRTGLTMVHPDLQHAWDESCLCFGIVQRYLRDGRNRQILLNRQKCPR